MAFEKRDNRNQTKTNIYLKNLPDLPEDVLTKTITDKCREFGEVNIFNPNLNLNLKN
jgi:hypothetical protein